MLIRRWRAPLHMYTVCMYVCVYARRDGVRWFVSLYTLQCEHSPRIGWKVHKQDYDQLVNPHFKTVLSSRTVALQIDIERKRLYTYTFCWQMKNFWKVCFQFHQGFGNLILPGEAFRLRGYYSRHPGQGIRACTEYKMNEALETYLPTYIRM